jgi:hypothetical protein
MKFLRTLRSTFFDPVFYSQITKDSIRPGIKLTFVLGLIGAAIFIAYISIALIPFTFSNFPTKLENSYPDNLVITIAKGVLSTNQPQPYYVPSTFEASSSPKYLVIFDTGDQLSGDLKQNSTFVIVKKDFAIMGGGDDSSQDRVVSFTSMQATTTVTKATAVSFIEKIRPYFKIAILLGIVMLLFIGTFFGALFWLLFHLIYLLFPAVLLFLFGLTRNPRFTFKKSYAIALYASIPIAIIAALIELSPYALPRFLYTVLVLLVAVINIVFMPPSVPVAPIEHQN